MSKLVKKQLLVSREETTAITLDNLSDKYNLEKNKRLNSIRKIKELEKENNLLKENIKSKSNSKFLINDVDDKNYKEKIERGIEKSNKIFIVNPHWNNELIGKLIKRYNEGIEIKVISTPMDKSG